MEKEKSIVIRKIALRVMIYAVGLVCLSAGLTLSTKVGLGTSPVISTPFVVSQIWGLPLGDMAFIWDCVFIAAQVVMHLVRRADNLKSVLLKDALQVLTSLFTTRFVNLFSMVIPEFQSLWARFLFMLTAIVLIGIGAALSLSMRLVANPADGFVQAIADLGRWNMGTVKNVVDFTCVAIAAIVALIFTHTVIGIGIGTIAAALLVGRVIALISKLFGQKLQKVAE